MSKILGTALRSAREAKGFTQQQVAERLGVTRAAVGQWEKGATEPATENLLQVCALLDLNISAATGGMVKIQPFQSLKDPEEIVRMVKDRRPEMRELEEELYRFLDANPSVRQEARDVPLYQSSHGGLDADFYRTEEIVDFVRRPPSYRRFNGKSDLYALYVTSSVLSPRYEIGDIIFLQSSRPTAPGDYAIFKLARPAAGDVTAWIFRRLVERTQTEIAVESFNPSRRDTLRTEEVEAIHRVINWSELIDP